MKREEILGWYKELLERAESLPTEEIGEDEFLYEVRPAHAWAIEAESAIAAVFPDGHAVRKAWDRIVTRGDAKRVNSVLDRLRGIFHGASSLVRGNRLGSLIDAIRTESESELLDQAATLADADHRAAATVIAGGALEAHLRHYVDKHGIQIAGDGSLSKYNNAVGQARKAIPSVYSANDGKLVEAWGGYRNEAAHNPGAFGRSKEDVKRMIEGIREFIARTG